MLKIILGQGVLEEWLAGHLSGLLDETKTFPDDDGPPWYDNLTAKWQLDRNNDYWLRRRHDGSHLVTARYDANRARIAGFADELRRCPQVTSVTVLPY